MRGAVERFEPAIDAGARTARLAGWRKAVAAVVAGATT